MKVPFIISIISLPLLLGCGTMVVTSSTTDSSTFDNSDFDANIGIVSLFPSGFSSTADPIIRTGQSIALSFDLIGEDYQYLQAKIVHCNYDWSKSNLLDIEYLSVTNEFQLDNFRYSSSTRVPYVTYDWVSPTLNESGNYTLIVYRDNNVSDVVFTRRFVVYSQEVLVSAEIEYSAVASRRRTHHQLVFEVDYGNLQVFNPLRDMPVRLLQNHNWNTSIHSLTPSLTRPDQTKLEYRLYNGQNEFPAGNEFRFADARATRFRGINVDRIVPTTDAFHLFLTADKVRSNIPYSNLFQDNEGTYTIANQNPGEDALQADYVWVNFTLEGAAANPPVYVKGKFNNWSPQQKHRLEYNANTKTHSGGVLLKQGLYDFQYHQDGSNPNTIAGNFVDTGNDYEILVYYRAPSTQHDQVVGYTKLSSRN